MIEFDRDAGFFDYNISIVRMYLIEQVCLLVSD